jgi:hypothetical protein
MIPRATLALLVLALPAALPAQQSLAAVAQSARAAVARGDLDALVRSSPGLQLQLPGVDPSAAVGPAQAVATLRGLLRRGQTAGVTLEGHREVGRDRGYVELRREFHVVGSRDRQVQRILLGYRRVDGVWRLVEVVVP